jgi:hypothetical protein
MASDEDKHDPSRRKVLDCMKWVGTGVLWSIAGGVPTSMGIIDGALADESNGLTFVQISDSHIGFSKPANPNVIITLEEAIGRIRALRVKPSFIIHTGDNSRRRVTSRAQWLSPNGGGRRSLRGKPLQRRRPFCLLLIDESGRLFRGHRAGISTHCCKLLLKFAVAFHAG